MALARYQPWRPSPQAARLIEAARSVCAEFAAAGMPLTVTQAYYRLVRAGHLPNTAAARKRLGIVLSRARLAGLIDWDLLVDHTQRLHRADPPAQPMNTLLEIWVEKESLAGVVAPVSTAHQVDWLACRGVPSLTELRAAAVRHSAALHAGRPVVVLLLVDLDDLGHAIENTVRTHLQTMLATHWIDAHPQLLGRARPGRGLAPKVVEEAMARRLGGRSPLVVDRVALTPAQLRHLELAADPDSGGHELDALDPRWLRTELDQAVVRQLDRACLVGAPTT